MGIEKRGTFSLEVILSYPHLSTEQILKIKACKSKQTQNIRVRQKCRVVRDRGNKRMPTLYKNIFLHPQHEVTTAALHLLEDKYTVSEK